MHEFPQALVPSFPLHQASGPFWRVGGGDLVHETPQALVPPFPLHQVSGPFRRVAGGELVHEFPQAFEPPFPLHQVSGHFRHGTGGELVHEFPQAIVPPFPLHQVSDSFRPAAGHVGAWLLAKPYSTVRPRQHRRRFPGAWPAMLAPGSPQSLCLPLGHANTDAVFPALGRPCWRLAPRKAIFHRQATPTPTPFSRRVADQVGAWFSAKPLSSVRPRQHRRRFPGAWPTKLAPGSPQSHIPPSGHANTGAVGALAPEGVVLDDERIRDCGEWRTTSGPPSAPWIRKTWCSATKE